MTYSFEILAEPYSWGRGEGKVASPVSSGGLMSRWMEGNGKTPHEALAIAAKVNPHWKVP